MWVFTRYGFYSIACASRSDGSLELQNRDYRYRLIILKASWVGIIGELALAGCGKMDDAT
jgi:hypothetical protein